MGSRSSKKKKIRNNPAPTIWNRKTGNGFPWINPVGGYGDMLMVSGVLKQLFERNRNKRFNLVERTRYRVIFKDHEAIEHIGFPNPGDSTLRVDYWSMEKPGSGNNRPYQILARGFGLPTPIDEQLYLAGVSDEAPGFSRMLPWKDLNIVIGPTSDSPRKMMRFGIWHQLVDMLTADGAFVLQPGLLRENRVRNAYSLRGMTTPQELVALLGRCHLVITHDNFLMHAAKLAGVPAVVVWGPTWHQMYGYKEHFHLQAEPSCGLQVEMGCIHCKEGNEKGSRYGTPCTAGPGHCVDTIGAERIYEAAKRALAGEKPSALTLSAV